MSLVTAEAAKEARVAARTNMFIAAVLTSDDGPCPVRIRNMSRCGALIEAPVTPRLGSKVVLERHHLRVTGEIAWIRGGRCGVKLDGTIMVAEWMANPANRKQIEVDRMVAEVRSGARSAAPACPPLIETDVRGHLATLRRLLDTLGEELAGDPAVFGHHAASLQRLDLAGQMIDALKQAVDPDAGRRQMGYLRLHNLRSSCVD